MPPRRPVTASPPRLVTAKVSRDVDKDLPEHLAALQCAESLRHLF